MGFGLGLLGRVVIFGAVGPVLTIAGTTGGLAIYGVYSILKK